MLKTRVIPTLLLRQGGLVKTIRFGEARYVGDPTNAIRIFNDKEVDEIAIFDIDAARNRHEPDWEMLSQINKEAFMPLSYGGGVRTVEEMRRILASGYEKIVLNNSVLNDTKLVSEAAAAFGNQSVVVCMDVKKDLFGHYRVYDHVRGRPTKWVPGEYAKRAEKAGAGELIVYSVDRDGTGKGYDISLLKEVTAAVSVPVVALGGAATVADFENAARNGGASAVAAGSMFVFYGPHRAVLITYPERTVLETALP